MFKLQQTYSRIALSKSGRRNIGCILLVFDYQAFTPPPQLLQITEIQNYSHLKVFYVKEKTIYQCGQLIRKFIEISRLQSSVANGCKER